MTTTTTSQSIANEIQASPKSGRIQIVSQVARKLLSEYGLSDWMIVIDKGPNVTRCGQCRPFLKQIGLSEHHLLEDSANDVADTILHEIAHAISPCSHHYKVWKEQYAQLLHKHLPDYAAEALRTERHCCRTFKKLLEFAERCEEQPIVPRLPSPFSGISYPWKTLQAFHADRWAGITSIRLIAETKTQYVWAADSDPQATRLVRKSTFSKKPLFRTWEEARAYLLEAETADLEEHKNSTHQGTRIFLKSVKEAIALLKDAVPNKPLALPSLF